MQLLGIDNIMYFVKDLEAGEKFYTEVLGLKKAWEDKDRKMIGFKFPSGDSEIVIQSDPNLPKFDYSFLVENVEEFVDEYEANGYKVFEGPIEVRCGKYAILEDVDGNKIPIIDLTKFGNKPRYV